LSVTKARISRSALVAAIVCVSAAVSGGGLIACSPQTRESSERQDEMPAPTIEQVLKVHTDSLMALHGVTGTGVGLCEGEPCIVVFVVKKTTDLLDKIPSQLDGYPTDIRESGPVRPRRQER
jgi:hypothetical protein